MIPLSDLTEAEREQFVRILHSSARITRHFELFLWLQGEVQHFIPHDVLVSVSGKFNTGELSFDVVSALPGVRTDNLLHCDIHKFSLYLHKRWIEQKQQMFSANLVDGLHLNDGCTCEFHTTLGKMRSVLVQGIRDERSGYDALYIMMHTAPHEEWRYRNMFELMVPHIDVASRRISGLPMASAKGVAMAKAEQELNRIGISPREVEILDWVTAGKTNYEIGIILNISAFTVKNHLQRIFKKLDVINRAQAVSKMESLTRAAQAS